MAKLTDKNKALAANIFKANPTVKTLYINDRGEFFTSSNLARNSVKKAEDITEIPKASVVTETESSKAQEQPDRPNVAKTVKAIKAAETLEALKEFEGDDRKTVQDALEARIKELEAPGTEPAKEPVKDPAQDNTNAQ
ncbi:hypothetical protein FUA48_16105 [Flavobacterium alkalisoli]|uniref:Uncharacterized protein n=1 Tax=Flavobacterium alkalisoli TaxID=2602769 RepID=A0A5B9FVP9_9FLAO|nr:hypothetical protein [Flavobacterium alkalisoli]QEE51044.1 hypothetical protein FUA48_16105 [Flavobacterium alkalisoli]